MLDERGQEDLFDLTGMLPPLENEQLLKSFPKLAANASATHTYQPFLLTRQEFERDILPRLHESLSPEMVQFVRARVSKTFEIRHKLKRLEKTIKKIVGPGNFSALWLNREAFSADSMEHRALVTEAVIHIYSPDALSEIVKLLYKNRIPMIPYGEGGGYNMGVTPMAPAVTLSVRGIDHISTVRPSRRSQGKFEITVGAGLPFKDLKAYLSNRGYVIRCDPNTPRAATGGIVATGSNGGRKAFEVVLEGRAVIASGSAVRFAVNPAEQELIDSEPFLMSNKFFSVRDPAHFAKSARKAINRGHVASASKDCQDVVIPLQGMKAAASHLAQKATSQAARRGRPISDPLENEENILPASVFVGSEGCTGFIYEVTFEIEKPQPWIQGSRWHFRDVEAAMAFTRAIKALDSSQEPQYFEIITGESIRRFLLQDFPTSFDVEDEAVLFLGCEGQSDDHVRRRLENFRSLARSSLSPDQQKSLVRIDDTNPELLAEGSPEFEHLILPREKLPKKLKTKCKTDMEIRTEYLPQVLELVRETPAAPQFQKKDVLFGHLTPRKTAIIHWNIGGFDLYDEESSHAAWDYLQNVISKAQKLAPKEDPFPSASFSGEHGIAGKAAFLWLNNLPEEDFHRMCAVKDAVDPEGLFNPETLFLRTRLARALRARLIGLSQQSMQKSLAESIAGRSTGFKSSHTEPSPEDESLDYSISEALKCTRCNSCKICPVIDAEHELRTENKGIGKEAVLPSKRDLVMFMEWVASLKKGANGQDPSMNAHIRGMFQEVGKLLSKCFYCRRCDKACPVEIDLHPMVRAFQTVGRLKSGSSWLWRFLYERLMGEDSFKDWTYKLFALGGILARPFLTRLLRIKQIPDWVKTYFSPPEFELHAYEPTQHGLKANSNDRFVQITSQARESEELAPEHAVAHVDEQDTQHVYIRYRGCMDTYGNTNATTSVDSYFKEYLGIGFIDLEKKLCCGFPFEADGLHERAQRSQFISLVEIAAAIKTTAHRLQQGTRLQFTVFSNCPTCAEAIREMKDILSDTKNRQKLRIEAQIPDSFDWQHLEFRVADTAELAMEIKAHIESTAQKSEDLISKKGLKSPINRIPKTVGLKTPCHNTSKATQAQLALLQSHYTAVEEYDRCCGLSGTGRLKHPKIGTKIAEKLFEQVRAAPAEAIVSGCPSCRDGVTIQQNILKGKKDPLSEFDVGGIFEQILKDTESSSCPKRARLKENVQP